MNGPGRMPDRVELVALDLLFVMIDLLVGALDEMVDAQGLVEQARELQEALSSYRPCARARRRPSLLSRARERAPVAIRVTGARLWWGLAINGRDHYALIQPAR